MTANQETRFSCDRCFDDEVMPLSTGGTPQERMAGPKNWTMLRIGSDPTVPPQHLCPVCSTMFANFMLKTLPGAGTTEESEDASRNA